METNIRNLFLALFGVFSLLSFTACTFGQFVDVEKIAGSDFSTTEWTTGINIGSKGKKAYVIAVDGTVMARDLVSGKQFWTAKTKGFAISSDLSSDEKFFAVGDSKGEVYIYDAENGTVLHKLIADRSLVNAVVWNIEGQLATGGSDGFIKIWDLKNSKPAIEFDTGSGAVTALKYLKNNLVVGTYSAKNRAGSISLWDPTKRSIVKTYVKAAPSPRALAISPDQKQIVASGFVKRSVLGLIPNGNLGVEISLRVLPDTDKAMDVVVWDAESGKEITFFEAELGARSIDFSPDGKYLACAGVNGVMIFDAKEDLYTEAGRLDSSLNISAVRFADNPFRMIVAREKLPFATVGANGLDKIFDPFINNLVMVATEAATPTFSFSDSKDTLTGGSNLESWKLKEKTAEADIAIWNALKNRLNGKEDEAKTAFKEIVKKYPKNAEAQRLNAVLFPVGDIVKSLQASTVADPNCASCFRSLGDIFYAKKMAQESIEAYKKSLALKPDWGLVKGRISKSYGMLALDLISNGNSSSNMQAAATALENALEYRPAEEQLYTNLGSVYYFGSKFDEAIEILLFAARLRPDHGRIYYNLGHAYRYKGDKAKAIKNYETYIAIGEEGEEERIERAREWVKELTKK